MTTPPDKPVGLSITSDPDTTAVTRPDAREARVLPDLPLRLLLASDLAPHEAVDDWAAGNRVRRVDKERFAPLMAELAPRLRIDVPDHLEDGGGQREVDLQFAALDAFRPGRIAGQIPALERLLAVRTLVHQAGTKAIDLDTFRTRLAETGINAAWAESLYRRLAAPEAAPEPERRPEPPADPPTADPASAPSSGEDGALDRLLGLVELDESDGADAQAPPRPDAAELVDVLVGALGRPAEAGPKVQSSAAETLLRELDDVLGRQVNAVLTHPEVRRLESAWRGLKWLVDRIDFRKNVRLEVLPVGKDALNTALYHQVLLPEHAKAPDAPGLSAILLDFAFDHRQPDVEQLEDLAETGASLQVPLIGALAPAFFGADDPTGLDTLPQINQHLEEPAFIPWNKLRDRSDARFLALALPPFLLRYPYGAMQSAEAFDFREDGGLWGGAALAVGAAMAESFAQTGWPTHLIDRRIGDLPTWSSAQGHIALAALVPEDKYGDLAKAGFVVLGGRANRDDLRLVRAQTLARPEAHDDLVARARAREHVTLACQLFVARAVGHLLTLQETIEPSPDPTETQARIRARLEAFLHTEGHTLPPEAVTVEPLTEAQLPEHTVWAVRLRPPAYILPREVSLLMGLRVPKVASG